MDQMIAAIIAEIALKKNKNVLLQTIYFGGGTPSMLSTPQLEKIISAINSSFNTINVSEITIEVNPDNITLDYLKGLKNIGINRLSIGVQSFYEQDLVWMNRSHNQSQAKTAIALAAQLGFESSSIDLIYGYNLLSADKWKNNLKIAFDSGLNHLSCYALTIEPNTPFAKINTSKNPIDNEGLAYEHFSILQELAADYGWDQYEISNLAKNNNYSKHNTAYWSGKPYIGVGPGAHSFDGAFKRQWNIGDNWKYIDELLVKNNIPFEFETLTELDRCNEDIMTGLRTKKGIPVRLISSFLSESNHPIHHYLNEKMALINNGYLHLSGAGWWQSDRIISSLFQTN